jgi:hypothetical protein
MSSESQSQSQSEVVLQSAPPAPARRPSLVRRLLPYAIALLALGWVLRATNLHELKRAVTHAPIGWFVVVSAVMLVLNCAADTFAMRSVFAWFGCRVPFVDLFIVRASTYLLAVVNYHVGQAAIIGYLYRARRVPFLRATGWILFIIGINVGTLFLIGSAGAAQADGELSILRLVPVVCAIGVVVYAGLLVWKPRFLAARSLFAPLFEMGVVGHIKGVLVRLPHIAVLLVWHFVSLRMFGVEVGVGEALLYLPAYFAVASLPINVNGLGVAQVVAIAFFARYVAVPADVVDLAKHKELQVAGVTAYSLATSGVSIILQLCLGLLCVRRGTQLGLAPEGEPEREREREAQATAVSS